MRRELRFLGHRSLFGFHRGAERYEILSQPRLAGLHPEKLSNATMQNEDTLGLFVYDPATAPLAG